MGLDPVYIHRALADLAQLREYLRGRATLSGAALAGDFTLRMAVLHTLQLAIQIVLDVGAHLLADRAGGPIDEYGEIGPRLARERLIPSDLGETLTRMARFRNLLVHQYADIDLDRVALVIQTGLADFETFESCIRAGMGTPRSS